MAAHGSRGLLFGTPSLLGIMSRFKAILHAGIN